MQLEKQDLRELPNGEFLIRVEVQKLGDAEMPLEVLLRTDDEK